MMNQAHEEGQRAPFHVLDRRVGAHPGEGHQQCGAEQRHDRRCVAQAVTGRTRPTRMPGSGVRTTDQLRTRPTKLSACPRSTADTSERSLRPAADMARSGGQGVASSNLASPTTRWRIVTPDQCRVHPATWPSSTSLSARELGPDRAHQREYATPRRGRCSLRLGSELVSLIR